MSYTSDDLVSAFQRGYLDGLSARHAHADLLEASENLLFRIRNIGYWNKPDTEMYIKALEAAVGRARGE